MLREIAYFLLIVAGILVEGTVFPVPLGLVGVILLGTLGSLGTLGKRDTRRGFSLHQSEAIYDVASFAFGLLADVVLIRPVGVTAGIYVGTVVFLRLYSRKIETDRLRYLLPFTGIVIVSYSSYFYGKWIWPVIISLLIVVLARVVASSRKKTRWQLV